MPGKRMIETNITEEDIKIEGSLRPQTLDDYIGQSKVKENLKELGYELLDSEYINSKTPLKVKCKEGHIIEREYNSIKEYPTCPKCYNSTRRLKYEYVKKII